MNRTESLLIAVFGAVMVTLGVVISGGLQPSAYAGTSDSGAGVVAVTGLASSNQEVLYLYDSESKHLAVYKVDASNRLALLAVRETLFDFKPQEYGKQDPPVKEMQEVWKKHLQATKQDPDAAAEGK